MQSYGGTARETTTIKHDGPFPGKRDKRREHSVPPQQLLTQLVLLVSVTCRIRGGTLHVHRSLLVKCLKRNQWPRMSWLTCQTWHAQRGTRDTATLTVLVPHEVLFAFRKRASNVKDSLDKDGMNPATRNLFVRARWEFGVEGVDPIGIELWDRNRELDMVTMGLPRLTGCWKALHVPLFVVHTSWQSMYRTVDDDLGLLRWSNGPGDSRCEPPRNATTSHHGRATTCSTKRRAGRQLLCRGLVSQVTGGDWNCLKTSSSFPKHKTTHGCCPWCEVTPAQLRHVPSTAPWRRRRLEHWGIIARSRRRVFVLCLLFGHQASHCTTIRPNWLQIADLGVGAHKKGRLFRCLLAKFAGRTQAERWARLRDRVRELYGATLATSGSKRSL